MSEDIRTRATKGIIRNTFRSMIRDGQKEITVRMLCERSGISRTTFYAHYKDLYDLIAEDEREAISQLGLTELQSAQSDPLAMEQVYLRILRHIDEYDWLYRYYFSRRGDSGFSLVLQDILSAVVDQLVEKKRFSKREYAELHVVYHAAGLLEVFRKWLFYGTNKPCTPEEYAHLLTESI